jgi:hypothetical protein
VVELVGETDIELPDPAKVPPQEPEYQLYTAPVPSEPPTLVRVTLPPVQMVVAPEMLVGALEFD